MNFNWPTKCRIKNLRIFPSNLFFKFSTFFSMKPYVDNYSNLHCLLVMGQLREAPIWINTNSKIVGPISIMGFYYILFSLQNSWKLRRLSIQRIWSHSAKSSERYWRDLSPHDTLGHRVLAKDQILSAYSVWMVI